jgi:hypothetical protein
MIKTCKITWGTPCRCLTIWGASWNFASLYHYIIWKCVSRFWTFSYASQSFSRAIYFISQRSWDVVLRITFFPQTWAGLGWLGLAWAGLGWLGLAWAGLGWLGLAWAGLGWLGLARAGLGWLGLAWAGLGWLGLAWGKHGECPGNARGMHGECPGNANGMPGECPGNAWGITILI